MQMGVFPTGDLQRALQLFGGELSSMGDACIFKASCQTRKQHRSVVIEPVISNQEAFPAEKMEGIRCESKKTNTSVISVVLLFSAMQADLVTDLLLIRGSQLR